MNETYIAYFGFACFVIGIMFGVAVRAVWVEAYDAVKEQKHQETVTEQGREIARLRAQVALHIGKEQ